MFQDFLSTLDIHLVELIDHEFICAAKDSRHNVVLLFAELDVATGSTTITVKNEKPGENNTCLSLLKEAFSAKFV